MRFKKLVNRCHSWLGTERTNAQHFCRLLRTRHERARDRRTANERDELSPFHLIELHRLPLTRVTV